MLFIEKPAGFNLKMEVVSCFLENMEGKFVLLHRQPQKSQGETWGVPAGRVEKEDSGISQAIIREVREETGIGLEKDEVKFIETVFVRYPDYDFVYHIFHAKKPFLSEDIIINSQEHQGKTLVTPKQALEMSLIQDLDECIKRFYSA